MIARAIACRRNPAIAASTESIALEVSQIAQLSGSMSSATGSRPSMCAANAIWTQSAGPKEAVKSCSRPASDHGGVDLVDVVAEAGEQLGGVVRGLLAERVEGRVRERRSRRDADPQAARLARRAGGERLAPAGAPRTRRRARSRRARRAAARSRRPCASARRPARGTARRRRAPSRCGRAGA